MLDLKILKACKSLSQTVAIVPDGRNHFPLTSALGPKYHTQKFENTELMLSLFHDAVSLTLVIIFIIANCPVS